MTKEEVYDSQISPLMTRIIAICKEHRIPILASFTLDVDEGLHCTTLLAEEEWEPSENLLDASRILLGNTRSGVMFVTTKDGEGKTTRIDAIL